MISYPRSCFLSRSCALSPLQPTFFALKLLCRGPLSLPEGFQRREITLLKSLVTLQLSNQVKSHPLITGHPTAPLRSNPIFVYAPRWYSKIDADVNIVLALQRQERARRLWYFAPSFFRAVSIYCGPPPPPLPCN